MPPAEAPRSPHPSDGARTPPPETPGGRRQRAEAGRRRGLDAPFATGGADLAPPERVADERRLVRLLIFMVALLVGVPTLLTLAAFIAQLATLRSAS